ncbi:transcriptional regulator [Streptomyces tsukubensis]|uniref:transcriptional regulator n=1 Tax=Streptomyces tsukubensis TaxID=83656 RepID=UPI00344C3360
MGAATAFSVAMATPAWADVAGRMEAVQSGRRIGMPDVDMVTRMTDRLAKLDGEFGGRRVRPMASSFLVNTVVPCLRAEEPSDVRSAMLSAAAFLSYLTGWMAVDEGAHGLARRYYTKGLELAGAAGDHSTYCHILRGMSVQAAGLGHGPSAVRLANAATASAPITGPRMVAFMAGQQAHAYAVAGDKTAAFGSLRETEKALDQASTTTTFGGFSASTLAYLSAQVRYSLGDVPGSIRSLEEHFRVRDDGDSHRSFLRFSALLAERRLEVGHLESACVTWNAVLDDYPTMQSGQVDRHVRQIAVRLRPYRSNAVARATYERAARAA